MQPAQKKIKIILDCDKINKITLNLIVFDRNESWNERF